MKRKTKAAKAVKVASVSQRSSAEVSASIARPLNVPSESPSPDPDAVTTAPKPVLPSRKCKAHKCKVVFVPVNEQHLYHDKRCRDKENSRNVRARYRSMKQQLGAKAG